MSRMIPLKIADMAVAACNEEIAKHLLEIGRLQGRVIALEGQLESEKAIAKALRSLSFMTAVPSEDYEKLKADLEKSDGVVFTQAVENERLKAELDRVTSQNGYAYTGLAVSMLREELSHKCHDNLEIRKAHQATVQMVRDLQAEVERLRKLGTEMGKHLPDTDEANRAYIDFEAGGRS